MKKIIGIAIFIMVILTTPLATSATTTISAGNANAFYCTQFGVDSIGSILPLFPFAISEISPSSLVSVVDASSNTGAGSNSHVTAITPRLSIEL